MQTFPGEVTGDQLLKDFKVVVADAEALLMATANQGDEKLAEIRAKAEASLKVAKARMADAQEALMLNTRAAARATDMYVHTNPWESMGVAAVVGLVFGFMLRR